MGLFAAVFPGPINLEVVRRAVGRGPQVGGAFGLGAVAADVILVTAATLGATALFSSLPDWGKGALGLFSSVIIMLIGLSALQAKIKPPPPVSPEEEALMASAPDTPGLRRLVKHFFFGLAITLTSPSTITFWLFASAFAAKFVGDEPDLKIALMTGGGVAASTATWVLGAVTIAGRYHKRLNPKHYLRLERVVGVGLLSIAAVSAFKALRYFF